MSHGAVGPGRPVLPAAGIRAHQALLSRSGEDHLGIDGHTTGDAIDVIHNILSHGGSSP